MVLTFIKIGIVIAVIVGAVGLGVVFWCQANPEKAQKMGVYQLRRRN